MALELKLLYGTVFSTKKIRIKIRGGESATLFFSTWALKVRFVFDLHPLPSQIAAGKCAGRKRGRPLAIAYRGLPLIGVRAVEV